MRRWLQSLVCISIAMAVLTSFFLLKQQLMSGIQREQFTALRLATAYGAEHPTTQAANIFANMVYNESGSQLALELFCDRKLGDAPQLLEQMTFGGVALAVVDSITLSQQIPQLYELLHVTPGLTPDEAQQQLVAHYDEISELLQQEQLGLLAVYMPDYRVIATASGPVQTPQNFAGLRLYQPSRSAVKHGAQGVQVKWEDLPQSIANDFADGGEMSLLEYADTDYSLVMPYLTVQSEVYSVDLLLVSEVSMGQLPSEAQHLIRGLASETLAQQKKLLLDAQRRALDQLAQKQVIFYPPALLETDLPTWISVLADTPWLLKGVSE